jgi:hypothetical protein
MSSPKHHLHSHLHGNQSNHAAASSKSDAHHEHDRTSVSSLNTAAFENSPPKQAPAHSHRTTTSMLRRHWAQHNTDVPFVIGAHIADDK